MRRQDNLFHDERMWSLIREKLGTKIFRVVEVGTRHGHWAMGLLECFIVNQLFCIDIWPRNRRFHRDASEWFKNLDGQWFRNVFPLRGMGTEWAKVLPYDDFDLVFIDGCHREVDVHADLCSWWPKTLKGGLVICHDAHGDDVAAGVLRFFESRPETPVVFSSGPAKAKSFWVIKTEE